MSWMELFISVLIVAMLALCSLPYTQSLYQKEKLQIQAQTIKNALWFAKTQAIVRGERLALTPLPHSSDWSQGMVLFVDNPRHQLLDATPPLYEWHWSERNLQVEWRGFQSNQYLIFSSDLSQSATNGFFIINDAQQQQIKLMVNRLARVKIAQKLRVENHAVSPYKR